MRVKDAFRENKNLTDATAVQKQVAKGYTNLAIIKRQVLTYYNLSNYITNKAALHVDTRKISQIITNI